MEFLKQLTYLQAFGLFWIENILIAGAVLLIGKWFRKQFNKRNLDNLIEDATKKEIMAALISITVNSLITFLGYYLWLKDWIHFDESISFSILLDFIILIIVMDWFMYVLHLLVHKTKIYNYIHKLHHVCKNPEPIDLFVLDPIETIAFGCLWIIVIMIYPANIFAVIGYLIINVLFGLLGHSAVEPFPNFWVRNPFTKYISTSTFHYQHHNNENYNFGFYTTIWDTFFNTLDPEYVEKFKKARIKN